MAVCIVIKDHAGWRKGNHVEAFGDRLQELVNGGIVTVVQTDTEKSKRLRNSKGHYI